MTLLKKFGIPLTKKLEDYNLIGIDFGDGEISAATVEQDALSGKLTVKGLSLQDSGVQWKNVNAFVVGPDNVSMVYDIKESQNDKGRRYYNYKKCPSDPAADYDFILDDASTCDITYRELMVKCFNRLVNILFESNVYSISRKKPTILLVGRPSSTGWAASELEYARMLQEGLELPENQEPVYVAIQSESTAALAREIDPRWDTQRVKKGEIVVVLDSGSSTFDITVIASGGVVGESSYQFGGNQLDANLLALLEKSAAQAHPGREFATLHGHKLGLRIAKEAFYGLKGTSRQAQLYDVDLLGENGVFTYRFLLDDAAMHTALNRVKVRTFKFKTDLAGNTSKDKPVNYNSWLDACKGIYRGFYEEMKGHFRKPSSDPAHPVVPDRIILSGGVSVMPEVQAAVEEAFGVKPRLTDRPNYSVSEGLAYVLGTEMQKKQLLDQLLAQLDEKLPDATALRTAIGDAGEDEEWNSFKGAMEEWAQSQDNLTFMDFSDLWKNKYFVYGIKNFVQNGAERWYKEQKVEEKLTELLQSHFTQLFPEYVDQFKANLPQLNFANLPTVNPEIGFNYKFFFGIDNTIRDADLTAPRDAAWRQKAYKHFLAVEQKIRKGGELKFTHTVKVEKGLIFKRTVDKNVVNVVKYPGIRSMYINSDQVTEQFAKNIRGNILQLLREPLEDYVESITPYFNMTARQRMNNKP